MQSCIRKKPNWCRKQEEWQTFALANHRRDQPSFRGTARMVRRYAPAPRIYHIHLPNTVSGRCEINCRDAVPVGCGTYKLKESHELIHELIRAWGGVNVIMVGDFRQLPPAGQTPLDTVPSHLSLLPVRSQVKSNHGLRLLWDGVTNWVDLKIQQRAQDQWWMEIVNQVRDGQLSQVHHQFLHGEMTDEPGCWSTIKKQCFEPTDHDKHGCSNNCTSRVGECGDCEQERRRRCRVFNSGI